MFVGHDARQQRVEALMNYECVSDAFGGGPEYLLH